MNTRRVHRDPNRGNRSIPLSARAVQAEEALPDYRLYVVKPLCGRCDDRWVETERGLARCPRCGPSAVAS